MDLVKKETRVVCNINFHRLQAEAVSRTLQERRVWVERAWKYDWNRYAI